ncbi:MAG: GMC family oxidoreductase, partial [Candidatus Methylomirabilis sp.]|nr:GMC family oxidoreductase [Deltaproteobacteria bacterium]
PMPPSPSAVPGILGNTRLSRFDVVLVGSGAGGSAAARVLATNGLTVCVLEAGPNYFLGLDDPRPGFPISLYSNDEVKLSVRALIGRRTRVEPMSFRPTAGAGERTFVGDVNALPKTVGGAAVHSDVKYPRSEAWDFRIRSELGEVPGASFADWPFDYDELEPYYAAAERLSGVQGVTGADPFAAPRSGPYPMETFGPRMYVDHVLSAGAEKLGLHPFPYPTAANARDYGGRPPCNDCGFCSGYGCPTNAKGSPAVTTLRDALLTGLCQVRHDCTATRIVTDASGRRATAVEYLDPQGRTERVEGDRVIVAANGIETPRLLQLSDPDGPGLGNSSGMLGRNLMFHFQTTGVGVYPQRFHVERGRSVTGGFSDFRGRPRDPKRPLAGIVEFGGYSEKIAESLVYVTTSGLRGSLLKDFLRANPQGAHIAVLTMQAEDAPQLTNRVDLD